MKKKSLLLGFSLATTLVASAANGQDSGGEAPLLVWLPPVLFIVLFFYFMNWLKKDNFKLSDALSKDEPDYFEASEAKPDPSDPTKTITITTRTPNYPKSASRVIAFLSGLTSIVIGICLITFYAYAFVYAKPMPDIEAIWKIIASLGIGVVPYVSKIAKGGPDKPGA